MKSFLFIFSLLFTSLLIKAQKVDSIYFNLYTDSLKKGTYNYINVDGKLSNGHWLPLTAKEIGFSASAGVFDGNSLLIAKDAGIEKVTIKAALKANSSIYKETTIYIKKMADNERLKTTEEILRPTGRNRKSS